ncbi:MAG: hypothetical protein ACRDDX_05790 [Cellulosilyticaceae bacterium]
MQQYQCGYCGYDMTGVERFSNTLDTMMLQHFDGVMPIGVQGLYDTTASNSVKCPKCGRAGYWVNPM